jgi:chromosome partitioning protein
VRANLDVVCGGPALSLVSASADAASEAGIDLGQNLRTAINKLFERQAYDIVFVDSGPGDVTLLKPLLEICTHLIVPTKEDEGSIDGVEFLAARYQKARANGSPIRLLGVVLFDVNPRATARNSMVLQNVAELLEGSGVDAFAATIRTDKATAVDQRNLHLTAQELVSVADTEKHNLLAALRAGRGRDGNRTWSRDPVPLANDYQNLTREILVRLSQSPAIVNAQEAQ